MFMCEYIYIKSNELKIESKKYKQKSILKIIIKHEYDLTF